MTNAQDTKPQNSKNIITMLKGQKHSSLNINVEYKILQKLGERNTVRKHSSKQLQIDQTKQESNLSWKTHWFLSNQISARKAYNNWDWGFKNEPTKIWSTLAFKWIIEHQLYGKNGKQIPPTRPWKINS